MVLLLNSEKQLSFQRLISRCCNYVSFIMGEKNWKKLLQANNLMRIISKEQKTQPWKLEKLKYGLYMQLMFHTLRRQIDFN